MVERFVEIGEIRKDVTGLLLPPGYTPPGPTITLNRDTGNIVGGREGYEGDIVLKDRNGQNRIWLDADNVMLDLAVKVQIVKLYYTSRKIEYPNKHNFHNFNKL